ncbi:MAG: protein kinase [Oscillibacter sp.]|nr:protein kinase [Oscillibacter sp.]
MKHPSEQNAMVTPWGRQYEYELTLQNLKDAAKVNGRSETAISSQIDLIRGVIGRGEHSVVYVGELKGSKRLVAVKYDHRDFSEHYHDISSKFENFKRADHDYIPKPIDFLPYKEETFILMEYTPGESLQHRINHVGVTQGEALDWTCQILKVLDYLHKGIQIRKEGGEVSKEDAPVEKVIHIIHGNIRTDNILLTPVREKDGTIKSEIRLIDFRLTDTKAKDSNPTGYGMFNNAWIEKADGTTQRGSLTEREFEEKAREDIYYTGAVLFRMLTGVFPTKKMNGSKKAKILRAYGVTKSVIKILCKSLDTDRPENRYKNAEEMLSAIRSLSVNDSRWKRIVWSGVALFAGCLAMFVLGAISLTLGNRFVSRTLHMETYAKRAMDEQESANYTQALSYALEAVEKRKFDPETAPEALDALSSVLSVYDFPPGYKPLHSSANLRGVPVRMLLSPDERFLVSLVRNKSSDGFLFQIFDTESGKELNLFPLNGNLTDFVIRNDNLLIYADETGVKGYSLSDQAAWTPKDVSAFAAVRLTLSPDGQTVVALSQDEREAYTYSVSGNEMSYVLRESPIPEETRNAMDLHLLELDTSGTRLAVSFSDGSIRVYRLDKPNEYAVLRKNSAYNHFEGGFYDTPDGASYFFYASSQIFSPDSKEFEQTKSECRFYNAVNLDNALDNTDEIVADYNLQMPRDEIMCALADKSGMYFSVKDEIYHILPQRGEKGTWGPYLETNGDVLFFRHDSKSERLLAVTDNQIVVLYEENGEVITRSIETALIGGVSFYDAFLSKNYLALAGQNKISVLRWTDDSAAQCATYPSGDFHTAARVRLDENGVPASVMLFHESGFRIYLLDGELVKETSFDNWERVLSIQYERTQDRFDVDRLKVTYEDETRYYSAQDGSLIRETLPSAGSSQNDAAMFQTENFRVEYSHGQSSKIYHKNRFIKELSEQPIYVSEYQGQLLISVLNANGERHSLLLDKHGKRLADFSGDCEIIPDGTLFADTQQGYILRERVLSLDELRRKAQDRRREIG